MPYGVLERRLSFADPAESAQGRSMAFRQLPMNLRDLRLATGKVARAHDARNEPGSLVRRRCAQRAPVFRPRWHRRCFKRATILAVKLEPLDQQRERLTLRRATYSAFQRADPVDAHPRTLGQRVLREPSSEPEPTQERSER